MFGASWGLVQGSLLIAAPLILFKITETTTADEDDIEEIMDESELKSVVSRHTEKVWVLPGGAVEGDDLDYAVARDRWIYVIDIIWDFAMETSGPKFKADEQDKEDGLSP